MQYLSKTWVLLLTIFLVTACGQKGPLFLPGNPSEIRSIPQTEPAGQDDEDDDEEQNENPR